VRVVVALGGNALLRRGQPMTAAAQRENVRTACKAIAPLAAAHEIVISHGNGPQVGLLALQGAAYKEVETYPLDVLGAETEGAIGYMIEQELGNLLPPQTPCATLLTMIEVDPEDPGFQNPTKFIGPTYEKAEAEKLAAARGWTIRQDGDKWRQVVASPQPRRIVELRAIRWLLDKGTVVICAGGGGIPVMRDESNSLVGIEAVIDKDFATELLARKVKADLFIMATDAEAVFLDWGTPKQRGIHRASPEALEKLTFPAGSMGPKVEAACRFARKTGGIAAIGALSDLAGIVAGQRGTLISSTYEGLSFHDGAAAKP